MECERIRLNGLVIAMNALVNCDGFIVAGEYFDYIMELDFTVGLCIVQTNLFT